jgi:signal transduction histidine kinase
VISELDTTPLARPSVLLVDDTPANLFALTAVLKPLGARLVEARSGEEALELLKRDQFAVVLLDVQMPGLNGLETAELIKKRESTRHIPIILISAISRELAHIFKGYESGVVDYLLKPIDPTILRAKVAVFVDLYRRGQTIREQATLLGEAKAKDAFLAIIAHELRTPLTAAKAQAQLAIRQLGDGDPATARALRSITRQIDRLVKLSGDLIDINRFEEGRMTLEHAEFDLAALMDEQRERIQALSGEAFELRVRCPSPLLVHADRDRVDQVLTNLLANSVRYSPKGGVIELAAEAKGDTVHVTVRDQGLGIAPELHAVVFERFGRAHGSMYGGIGLGLTISRSIVELHGGRIWIESDGVPGQGTTVHVDLPLRKPTVGAVSAGPRAAD